MVGQNGVQGMANLQDLAGVDLDIRCLALISAQRLVDHHAGIGQAGTLALGTTGNQESTHAGRLANTQGRNVRLDELHGVVDRHARSYGATWAVDVQVDIFVRVFGFQEQQLGNHKVRHVIFNRANQENHPLLEQTRINVEGTLSTCRLLNYHRHQAGAGYHCRAIKRFLRHVRLNSLWTMGMDSCGGYPDLAIRTPLNTYTLPAVSPDENSRTRRLFPESGTGQKSPGLISAAADQQRPLLRTSFSSRLPWPGPERNRPLHLPGPKTQSGPSGPGCC